MTFGFSTSRDRTQFLPPMLLKVTFWQLQFVEKMTLCLHFHSPSWSGSNGDRKILWMKDFWIQMQFFHDLLWAIRFFLQLFHRLVDMFRVYSFFCYFLWFSARFSGTQSGEEGRSGEVGAERKLSWEQFIGTAVQIKQIQINSNHILFLIIAIESKNVKSNIKWTMSIHKKSSMAMSADDAVRTKESKQRVKFFKHKIQ